jgi:hypothetical protein
MRNFITAKHNQNNKVEDEMGTACSIHGENMNPHMVFVGMLERGRPLGRPTSERIIL